MNTFYAIFLQIVILTPQGEIETSISQVNNRVLCERVANIYHRDFMLQKAAIRKQKTTPGYVFNIRDRRNKLLLSKCDSVRVIKISKL